jgi:P-type E1-E2 ATPase
MIELSIPGRGIIQLHHLVSDVNGTLAVDGLLIGGVRQALLQLQDRLELHLLTADTHGRQRRIDQRLWIQATRIQPGDEAAAKADYVREIGAEGVVAIGQGANDRAMLAEAAIGIAVLSEEGLSVETLQSTQVLVPDIHAALALLENPLRLVASLRR